LKQYPTPYAQKPVSSPSPRKAWIETPFCTITRTRVQRRLPPGRRGLKLLKAFNRRIFSSRLPPGRRGLKLVNAITASKDSGRLPPGRRGLKQSCCVMIAAFWCRLPPGRRGLKRGVPEQQQPV